VEKQRVAGISRDGVVGGQLPLVGGHAQGTVMTRSLLFRIATLFALGVMLMVPLLSIGGLVQQRQKARDLVVQEIARSAAYAQTITGPILMVPYVRTVTEQQIDGARTVLVTREVAGELRLLPQRFDLAGQLTTQERQRGIYRARIFDATNHISGHCEWKGPPPSSLFMVPVAPP